MTRHTISSPPSSQQFIVLLRQKMFRRCTVQTAHGHCAAATSASCDCPEPFDRPARLRDLKHKRVSAWLGCQDAWAPQKTPQCTLGTPVQTPGGCARAGPACQDLRAPSAFRLSRLLFQPRRANLFRCSRSRHKPLGRGERTSSLPCCSNEKRTFYYKVVSEHGEGPTHMYLYIWVGFMGVAAWD